MKIKIDTQLFLDLCTAGFFALFSMILMMLVIPNGFTAKFLLIGIKLTFLAFSILSILFLTSKFFNKSFQFKKKINFPELKDCVLLLLPMIPVFNYILINIEYLDIFGFFYLIGTTLIFSFFFSFILPIIFSYFASLKILMFLGLAISFLILNMPKMSNNHNPGDNLLNTQNIAEGVYLISLFIILFGLYCFKKKIAYITIIIFTATGILINFYNHALNGPNKIDEKQTNRIKNFLENKNNKIVKNKNIYILVYESYASLETLNHYGFDNTDQINFLKKNGFKVYNGIYSNSGISLGTTSRLLEISGKIKRDGRYHTSGNAFGLDIFKANGYKTIGVFNSPFYFGSSQISWDEYYPKESVVQLGGKTLTRAIFEGEFRFNIFNDKYDYNKYLNIKKKYLNSNQKSIFFYTHNKYPGHSQNVGKCYSNQKELYFDGMKKANIEMKRDILDIINSDKNSIIVLLSDHGPYLTKNCHNLKNYDVNEIDKYDLQDRYGTFLSIFWPEDIIDNDDNMVIIQDILPSILSNITNNKNLFDELKIERRFFDRFKTIAGGVDVHNGIIRGGKDNGKPLFDKRSYSINN